MKINIPETDQKRVVIVGGGFAGLAVARALSSSDYQVVLVDKNNYHQFQPLFYQVAMAGLEPSSIVFPFRKLFQRSKNVFFRVTEVKAVEPENNRVITDLGILNYDYLVLSFGADTNFFGNDHIAKLAIPMKSVSEALYLRNKILTDYEQALSIPDYESRQPFIDILIVGGGPTGVEVAGSLAEMKKYIVPKDYKELNPEEIDIYLVQGGDKLLNGYSENASQKAYEYLDKLGVKIILGTYVTGFDGENVQMKNGEVIKCRKVIWAAGITGNKIEGLPEGTVVRGNRIKVDRTSKVEGLDNVFALGDIAYMEEGEAYPNGHPQVAQVAIQQANNFSKNLKGLPKGKTPTPFSYKDKGSMATIGRNLAVADLPYYKTHGILAWFIWLFIHLFYLIGFKNRVFVFFNWVWNYITYDQSLRLIIRPKVKKESVDTPV